MADSSLLPIVVGGVFSVAAAGVGAIFARWRSKRESSAAYAKVIAEAAQLAVSALSQALGELQSENDRLRGNGAARSTRSPH
jgi:hypothetical protein